jgi:hypothetical protein
MKVIKARRMTLTVHVARMGEMRNEYNTFAISLKGRDLGRSSRRWEDDIRKDLMEAVFETSEQAACIRRCIQKFPD